MSGRHEKPNDSGDNITILYGDDETTARARRAAAHHLEGDAKRIALAMDEYQGTFASLEEYARLEIEEHIAPAMSWLLDGYIDLAKLAKDWIQLGRNWALPDSAPGSSDTAAVHVFLSSNPVKPSTQG